jgi:hypothetical protein|tara:strand:- start:688 stop:1215 length:528 start_codon:yes stop_codon:yes gene_type:complete
MTSPKAKEMVTSPLNNAGKQQMSNSKFNKRSMSTDGKYTKLVKPKFNHLYRISLVTGMENRFTGNQSNMRSGYINTSEAGDFANHGGVRRIHDGTSEKELSKALSTYLNKTGAGDYNMPRLIGEKVHASNTRNQPNWSFQSRTKLAWFPGRNVDFQASSSPKATQYSPKHDRDFK